MDETKLEGKLMRTHKHLLTPIVLVCSLFAQLLSAKEGEVKTSTFEQEWLKTLISIEVAEPNKKVEPRGSGFLVQTPGGHAALVTAKHVVFDEKGKLCANLAYRVNRKKEPSVLLAEAEVAKYEPVGWVKSRGCDVMCRLMAADVGNMDALRIPCSSFLVTPQIEPGAPLFIVGFPMGMRSEEYSTPIVRRGMVARTESHTIIADAFVFPGNSGGPVVYAPTTPLGKGLTSKLLQGQWLVGLISNYVPYRDVAVSLQTERPRVIFEENSGLCNVVPASAILELLNGREFQAADKKDEDGQSKQPKESTATQSQ